MKLLRQSTTAVPKVGPFLSSTDGVTASTALTIAQADCILFKNYGAGAQKNSSTSATHDTGGYYAVTLNTTDTATLGPLQLLISKSGALPVWDEWVVVPSNMYDAYVSNSVRYKVDLDQIGTSQAARDYFLASVNQIETGTTDNTALTATTSVFETSSITTAASEHWVGRVIVFTSGTLAKQSARITAYSLSSGRGRFTHTVVTSAPANGTTFVIV
jgi:hypothetical protein